MITEVVLLDKESMVKEMIYAPTKTDCMCEQRDKDIMKAVTQGEEFYKFTAKGIKGAETIKNDENLWYDSNMQIYQVCCGRGEDMHGTVIPNTFYVRLIGFGYDYDELLNKNNKINNKGEF